MNITNIKLGPKYTDHQRMMTALAEENFCAKRVVAGCDSQLIARADPMTLSAIDAKVKDGGGLSFEEAFSGMLLVVGATNNLIRDELFPKTTFSEMLSKGTGFLQLMAVKEAFSGLTPEEIAGMVAAGTLDLVFRPAIPSVVETCGMGGDRGWGTKEVKTISASTLSALVLASLRVPSFKHGSYGNTTRVGSTDVPINFGAKICHRSAAEILNLFAETGFWFSDAHSVKTIHYLSHLLMVETVNHIVGPMTVPISGETKLSKLIGVNHHVHPEAIAKAYAVLHQRGFINLNGVCVVCGLDTEPPEGEENNQRWVVEHSFLDEVSPRATFVSLAKGGNFLGNFILTDESFGAAPLDEKSLKVRNNVPSLMVANELTLRGEHPELSSYLARNAALGLLVSEGLDANNPLAELPVCYQKCLEAIESGKAFRTLQHYVEASGGSFRSWL